MALGTLALCTVAMIVTRQQVDPAKMTNFGLPSVLPPVFFIALAGLTVTFCLNLRSRELRRAALIAHIGALIFMLYGIAPLVEDSARTQIAWKLAGVADYVVRHGTIDPNIDHFFNWPGFFVLTALVTRSAGLENVISLAPWAPVFFNALYALALFGILRTASADPRIPWLGVWLFAIANWIGQDYLSPQAVSYFLYLVVMAILLKWFASYGNAVATPARRLADQFRAYVRRADRAPAPSTAPQRMGLVAIVVTVFAAIVVSHQLTPFALTAIVAALVVSHRLTTVGMPAVMLTLGVTWASYMAVKYLDGHLEQLLRPVGSVSENVDANLTDRFVGSTEHLLVNVFRCATTAAVWTLALIGAIRRARAGHADSPFVLIAVTPFLLLPLQPYGGELLLRVYFLTLPAMVLFAAAAFLRRTSSTISARATVGIGVTSLVLIGSSLVARYGDERMHYFTPAERAAVAHLYAVAPPGSRLVALEANLPWRNVAYDDYDYKSAEPFVIADDTHGLIGLLTEHSPSYLIVTRAQFAAGETAGGPTRKTWSRLYHELRRFGVLRRVYANADARIFAVTRDRQARASRGYDMLAAAHST